MPVYQIQVKRYYIAEVIAESADEACDYAQSYDESYMVLKDQDLEIIESRPVTKEDL